MYSRADCVAGFPYAMASAEMTPPNLAMSPQSGSTRRRQLLAADSSDLSPGLADTAYGTVLLELVDDFTVDYNVTLHNVELLDNPGNITYSHLHKQDQNLTHVGYLAGSEDEALNFALPAFGDVLLTAGSIDLSELPEQGSSLVNFTSITWLELLEENLLADIHSENYMPPNELLVGTFVLFGGGTNGFAQL